MLFPRRYIKHERIACRHGGMELQTLARNFELKTTQWFEFYAEHFDCVELNASFYRLPQEQTVKDWKKRAPDDFKFCFKLSRYITQMKKLNDVQEPLQLFFERMKPLQTCAGPVLIQLPPNLGFNAERAENFFKLLQRYKTYRFALEPRHAAWLAADALALLEKYRVAFVIAESGGKFPYQEAVTTDFVYLRFHGPHALYASEYSRDALDKYARLTKNWLAAGHAVWAFFNNDGFGFAIKNARELRALVNSS
jgi:uncharacterized protein YecE (DUF72 family)